jgi:hypothetical protein
MVGGYIWSDALSLFSKRVIIYPTDDDILIAAGITSCMPGAQKQS